MRWKMHVLIRTPIWQSAVNLHQVLRTLQLSGNPWEPFTLNNPVLIPNRCSSSTVVQIRPQLQQEKTNPTLVGMPWITKSIYLRQSLTRPSIKPMLMATSKCQNLISSKSKTWFRAELELPTPTHRLTKIQKLMANRLLRSARSTSTKLCRTSLEICK